MRGNKYLASAAGLAVIGLLATACAGTPAPEGTNSPGGTTDTSAPPAAEATPDFYRLSHT